MPSKYTEVSCSVNRRSAARTSTQLATGTQPGQGQCGVRPRRDDEAQLGRQVVDQERHRLVDGGCVDDVIVVEDQDDLLVGGGQVVERGWSAPR